MELINKIKSKISKKEFIFICIFSIVIVFNYFIFNQFDVIFHNQAEFGVSVKEVIWPFIWISFLILLALITILTAICCRFKKAFPYIIAILLGLTIASYIQVLFMNKEELMALDGSMLYETLGQFILNITIYFIIIMMPIAILIFEKKKNKNFTKKLVLGLCVIIFGMQSIGLITASASAPKPASDNELYYFSIDEALKLSKNENIIVFVLDRLDTSYVNAIFRDYPQTKETFSGFTYYTNNISQYPGTFPSVPSILTNKTFDKNTKKQIDYLQQAWRDEILFDALHDNNYKVNGLLDSIATVYDFNDLNGEHYNIKFDNIEKVRKENRIVKGGSFFGAMLSFAQTRQSPDCFKWAFRNDNYLDIANYCVKIKKTPDHFPRTISPNSDLKFYSKLKDPQGGLSANENDNVFSFVHLQASHNPYMYNESAQRGASDPIAQTRGAFKILDEYFTQMKALGIYENSTIILMADHGIWDNPMEIVNVSMSSLFIKEKGVGSGALKTDDHSQMANSNFTSTILEIIGENEKKNLQPSYFDILKNGGIQTRYFYYVKWTNLNSCKYFNTYKIDGDANKIENWIKLAD